MEPAELLSSCTSPPTSFCFQHLPREIFVSLERPASCSIQGQTLPPTYCKSILGHLLVPAAAISYKLDPCFIVFKRLIESRRVSTWWRDAIDAAEWHLSRAAMYWAYRWFLRACRRRQLTSARWFAMVFRLNCSQMRYGISEAIGTPCGSDIYGSSTKLTESLETVRWVIEAAQLSVDIVRIYRLLATMCAHGRLDVAKWLVERFGLDASDVRADRNRVLMGACERGYTEVVQWLVSTFKLVWCPKCTRRARTNGHTELANWAELTWRKDAREWARHQSTKKPGFISVTAAL
jgi:hypothetical protein